MQLVEAYEVFGVSSSASPEELTQAYTRQRASFEAGVLRAANDSVKVKFQKQLDDLEDARKVLLPNYSPTPPPADGAMDAPIPALGGGPAYGGPNPTPHGLFDTPLTATQFADLPTPSPQLTGGGLNFTAPGMHGSASSDGTGFAGGQGDGSTAANAAGAAAAGISISPGQVLLNRYDVKNVLGVGGMGAVFGAYDRVLGMDVALKVLLPALARNASARERFLHEAKISISLTHPNIANVKEVQQEGDLCFLTMELLKGRTLRHEIEAKASVKMPFSAKEVIELCKPVCDALNYAHQFTVHRDIKPENIWLCKDGSVKIMDFGIAQLLSPTRMTQTAMAMGTAFYMAPEQMQSAKEVDRRADQYSLAVVIYELLAGKLPTGRAKALSEIRTDVPGPLSSAVDKALSTNPEDRFDTMEQFQQSMSKKGHTAHSKKKFLVTLAVLAGVAGATVVATNENLRTQVGNMFKSATPPEALKVEREGKAIKVSWKDTSPDLTTGFIVQRQEDGTDKPETFDKPASVKEYVDNVKLKPGTKYTYSIIAKGKKEFASAPTAPQSIETLPGPAEPISISKCDPLPTDPEHSLQVVWGAGLGKGPGVKRSLERMVEDTNQWETLPTDEGVFNEGRFKDAGLTPDTRYSYRLVLVNEGGKTEGPVVSQFTNPPKPEKFEAKLTEDKKIRLVWNAPLKENRKLTLKKGGREELILTPDDEKSQSFVFPEVEAGGTYDFSLAILGPNKTVGNPATTNITIPPAQPNVAKVVKAAPNSLELQWDKVDKTVKEIELRRKEGDGDEFISLTKVPAAQTRFTDKTVSEGKKYAYQLVTWNAGGPSDPSEPSEPEVARLPAPNPPKFAPKPKDGKKEVLVSWSFSKNEDLIGLDKLVVERATSSEGPYTEIRSIGAPFTSLSGSFDDHQGLVDGKEYFYRMNVHARNYGNPIIVDFSQPIIPKVQLVVQPGAAGGTAGAVPAPTPSIVFRTGAVALPTQPPFRPDDPDKLLKGLSTPTPTPQAGKGGGSSGGGGAAAAKAKKAPTPTPVGGGGPSVSLPTPP
ncbi:MAG: protein kinase domain-containing protein [Candidatus Sumerlaeaceae bacterium]